MKLIYLIIYWPFYFLYMTSSCKDEIILDLKANDLWKINVLLSMVEAGKNKYFRSLFYFRNRNILSKILRVFYPKEPYFIIDINSKLGGGLRLAHPYSTIINAKSIGKNCYINHLVTIGEKNGLRPIIGDNVEIHANSSLIGGITIGDNVIIGAGSVVVKNIPSNSVVVGNPARIISK